MRVVVIGGYGNFGARVCRGLAGSPGIEVIAAGRHPDAGRGGLLVPDLQHARLDHSARDFPAALKRLAPGLVIHCAGPFQSQDYRVALAAMAAGAHYLDLADGRQFVTRFPYYVHPAARAARRDRKSTRLNSSHVERSYAVFCSKKKKNSKQAGADRATRCWVSRKRVIYGKA